MATSIDDVIDGAAQAKDVDPRLLKTIGMMESSLGRNTGRSLPDDPDSPVGFFQLRPSTARAMLGRAPTSLAEEAHAAASYLSQGLDATGNPQGALAYYFAGPNTSGWGPKTAAYVAKGSAIYPTMTVQPGKSGDTAIRGAVDRARAGQQGGSQTDADTAAGMAVLNGGKAPAPSQQQAPADQPETSQDPDTAAGMAVLNATPKPAKAAAASAPPPPPPATPAVDDLGMPIPGTGGPEIRMPGQDVANRVIGAGVEGWRNTEPVVTSLGEEAINSTGPVGRFIVNPALKIAGGVMGAGNALASAGMQVGTEIGTATGHPELGRDINMLAQVAPVAGMPGMAGPAGVTRAGMEANAGLRPRPPNALQPEPPPEPVYASGVGPVAPEIAVRGEGRPVGPTSKVPPTPEPTGGAVGADVTASPIPPKTPIERVRDLEKAVLQTAEERAGPSLVDNNPYVPGIPPRLLASRDFSKSVNALDAKVASATDPAFRDAVDANARARNEGMVDHLRENAGDLTALDQAHEARLNVSPHAMRVFESERPVDAAGLVAKIDDLLNGPEGKQKAVRTTLGDVRASLFDSDGNLEALPSRLYGARRNLTDLLKKGVKGTGDLADDVRASKQILSGLLDDFDPLITSGAPRFTEYLKAWSDASKPIDQMEFLQNYFSGSKKITNDAGYLQPGKVQKMFDDVLQGNRARGVNKAKSLTDEQIASIEAVRNELQADQLRDRLASVRGSDTFQQFNSRLFGEGPVVNALRHARDIGLGAATGGIYNLGVKPIMETNRLRRIERKTAARKRQLLEPPNALGPD